MNNGTVYGGQQCDSCKPAVYYGQPTKCVKPGAGDNENLEVGGCEEFDVCKQCTCYGNINETEIWRDNCHADGSGDLVCTGCLGHTTGKQCENCQDGYYGVATRLDTDGILGLGHVIGANLTSLKCRKCDCNGQALDRVTVEGNEIDGIDGDMCNTTATGEWGEFKCRCNEADGYIGDKCRKCKRGYKLVVGYNATGFPDPAYDYCEPCSDCVLNLYNDVLIPLETMLTDLENVTSKVNETIFSDIQGIESVYTDLDNRVATFENSDKPNVSRGHCVVRDHPPELPERYHRTRLQRNQRRWPGRLHRSENGGSGAG
eukprot:Opistho-2@92184